MIIDNKIDALDTMYPSYGFICNHKISFSDMRYSTLYGYSIENCIIKIDNKEYKLEKENYCSIHIGNNTVDIFGKFVGIFRMGFKGQNLIGEIPKKTGRLSYIDGCSDELLVYPPRLGDPSLSYLYFPKKTKQTVHNHPSIRIGYILSGSGYAELNETKIQLKNNMLFMLNEKEIHRFVTKNEEMRLIAFHPDGDWGPTDESHTMLNRTHNINIK